MSPSILEIPPQRIEKEPVRGVAFNAFLGAAFDEFGCVESSTQSIKVLAQRLKRLHRLRLCHNVQVPSLSEKEGPVIQRLYVPGQLARRSTNSFGDNIDFPDIRAIERNDLVRIA